MILLSKQNNLHPNLKAVEKTRESFNPQFISDDEEKKRLSEIIEKGHIESILIRYELEINLKIIILEFLFHLFKIKKEAKYRYVAISKPTITPIYVDGGNHYVKIHFPFESDFDKIEKYDEGITIKNKIDKKYEVFIKLVNLIEISGLKKWKCLKLN